MVAGEIEDKGDPFDVAFGVLAAVGFDVGVIGDFR